MHTPTPWEVAPYSDDCDGPLEIVSEYRERGDKKIANWIAECDLQDDIDMNHANAAFIVRACNAHDELVAAMRDLIRDANRLCDGAREIHPGGSYEADCRLTITTAREALRKAEGVHD